MTTVYGVTFVGARDQIERQLKDKRALPEEECWSGASYLAKKVIRIVYMHLPVTTNNTPNQTLLAIGDLFSGATAIQHWLNMCARLIAKSIPAERLPEAMEEYNSRRKHGVNRAGLPLTRLKKEQMTSVVWTTGLGLPIVQPYRKSNSPAEGEFRSLFYLFAALLMCSLCSQFVEASNGIPAELYTQSGCDAHDVDCT
jgi:DNA-directed RNA polymerase